MITRHALSPPSDQRWVPVPAPVPAGLSLLPAGDLGGRDSAARKRRSAFLAGLGLTGPFVRPDQRHTRRVLAVPEDMGSGGPGAGEGGIASDSGVIGDGLITRGPATLCVTVADCMPIFLYDPHSGARGILHSGWKGTGILARAVQALGERYDSRPGDIHVTFGPAIGSCCYRVNRERARLFATLWGPESVVEREGAPYLDLRAANEAIVRSLGLGGLEVVTDCSVCGGPFASFRGQGPETYTHMLAWI